MSAAILDRLLQGGRLSRAEADGLVTAMLEGALPPAQVAAALVLLRARGETVDELVGAVTAVRERARRVVVADPNVVDTCGTGGDASGTFNVSTAAAIVAAACGVTVAKHGNRSVSSRCGSADVLEALGAHLELDDAQATACIDTVGLGFLFAPAHHPAFKQVAAVRRELGVRTLFNLIGPLVNPAGARRQVVGVFSPELVPLLAQVLAELGVDHALVVHGDGLDELTTCGESTVVEVRGAERRSFTVSPEALGLRRARLDELRGGDAQTNARIVREVLAGAPGAPRDVVLLNAAAALVVGDRASSLAEGLEIAADAVDTGAAERLLGRFVRATRGQLDTLDRVLSVRRPDAWPGPRAATRAPGPLSAGASARAPASAPAAGRLASALSLPGGPVRVIAEVKRASPSAGRIGDIADPVALARSYAHAEAAAVSVLTEPAFFRGSLEDLRAVAGAVGLPVLRKDFLVHPRQLDAAREAGAAAVLLIAAVLGARLRAMLDAARAAGLDALVEVHDEAELELALEAGAALVGVNHRNLRTLEIDLGLSARLAPRVPPTVRLVCESGIRTLDDAKRLRDAGASNFLVGEALVRAAEPGAFLRALRALR